MNFFRLNFLLLLVSYSSASQIEVKGNVSDSSNEKVVSANVVLLNSNEEIISGTSTDESGDFKLSLKTGEYKLKISFLGYEDWIKVISVNQQNINLGQIILKESSSELETVYLVAEKKASIFKKNVTVYNINDQLQKASINSASILKKVPGIDITSEIKLEGRSGVIVLVNGKEKFSNSKEALGFLTSLSSEEIKAIEVNNTPGAKYGNGINGIINIVLAKDDSQGLNGTFQGYIDSGEHANYGSSLYLNYRKNAVNTYLTLRNDNDNNLKERDARTRYFQSETLFIDEKDRSVEKPKDYYVQAGIDYDINSKNSLNFTTNFNLRKTDQNITNNLSYLNNSNSIDSIIAFNENKDFDYSRTHLNLNYTSLLDTIYKQKLVINANYIKDNSEEESVFNQEFFNASGGILNPTSEFQGDINDNIELKSGSLDYEIFLKKDYEIYIGSRYVQTITDNNISYQELTGESIPSNVFQSSNSNYEENLVSSYATLMRYKPVWGYEIGLRYESANISGKSSGSSSKVNRTFNGLFPSLLVRYNLDKNNRFLFQAKQLAGRPKFYQLDENIKYVSPNEIIQGNLNLSQFNLYLLAIRYSLKDKYHIYLRYDYIDNYIPQTLFVSENDDNIIKSTYENAGKLSGLQLTINFPIKISKSWNIRNYINSFYTVSRSNDARFTGLDYSTVNLFYRITNSISLPKEYYFDLSFAYKTTAQINQTKTSPLYSLDFSITKSFFQNRLKFSLEGNDLLRTSIEKGVTNINRIAIENYRVFEDSRRIAINLSFDFGSRNIKRNRWRKTGIEEDKSRLKKKK